jgi:hypothetical protein
MGATGTSHTLRPSPAGSASAASAREEQFQWADLNLGDGFLLTEEGLLHSKPEQALSRPVITS